MSELYQTFCESTGISTDTRSVKKNNLFFALKGGNFDGNKYAEQALKNGASFAVVSDITLKGDQYIFVHDTLEALQTLAKYHREALRATCKFIGITGTNGKTTTKELLYQVVSTSFKTQATFGNLNNHIGVPLTVLSISNTTEIAIIEMGANHVNEIKELCDIVSPDIGLITNIGKAHLEGFGSYENIIKTKLELYDSVESAINGTIVYNQDDDILTKNLPSNVKTIAYSLETDSKIRGQVEKSNSTQSLFFSWKFSGKKYNCSTAMIGRFNVHNCLAAIATGIHLNIDVKKINNALELYQPTNNRSQNLNTQKNTIILDAYNCNPTSLENALDSFSELDGEKAVILGEMLELGEYSTIEHEKAYAHGISVTPNAFFIGEEYAKIANNKNKHVFKDKVAFIHFLKQEPILGKTILIKGSRGIALEELVQYL